MPWSVPIFASTARRRSTEARSTGSGVGDGCVRSRSAISSRIVTAVAVAVVLLLGGVALGGQALGLARLLEHRPSLRQRGLGLGAVLAGHGERVAVVLEALERVLAGLETRGRLGDRVLGDLEPARVLDAAGLQVVERPLELALGAAGAAVGAADRGLEPVAQGALVALEPGQLVVADRRRRAEEALGRDARDRGQLLVGAGGIGDRVAAELEADLPLGAAERLRQPALARARRPRPRT